MPCVKVIPSPGLSGSEVQAFLQSLRVELTSGPAACRSDFISDVDAVLELENETFYVLETFRCGADFQWRSAIEAKRRIHDPSPGQLFAAKKIGGERQQC